MCVCGHVGVCVYNPVNCNTIKLNFNQPKY